METETDMRVRSRYFAIELLALAFLSVSLGLAADKKPTVEKKVEKSPDRPQSAVMFKLDGESFTVEQYATFLQANQGLVKSAVNSDEGKGNVIREMAATALLRKQIFKEGLLDSKKEITADEVKKAYEELAKNHFPRPATPDESLIFAYYNEHSQKYGIPKTVRLNEILFKVAKGADEKTRENAKKRAEESLSKLKSGSDFQTLASEVTENKLAKLTRGDIGFLSVADNPWLSKGIDSLKIGGISEVTESPEGYVILQLTEEHPALITPYVNIRDRVAKDLIDDSQQKLRKEYVKELAKGLSWEVYDPSLKAILGGVLFP